MTPDHRSPRNSRPVSTPWDDEPSPWDDDEPFPWPEPSDRRPPATAGQVVALIVAVALTLAWVAVIAYIVALLWAIIR